jgi:hypothetical protein
MEAFHVLPTQRPHHDQYHADSRVQPEATDSYPAAIRHWILQTTLRPVLNAATTLKRTGPCNQVSAHKGCLASQRFREIQT